VKDVKTGSCHSSAHVYCSARFSNLRIHRFPDLVQACLSSIFRSGRPRTSRVNAVLLACVHRTGTSRSGHKINPAECSCGEATERHCLCVYVLKKVLLFRARGISKFQRSFPSRWGWPRPTSTKAPYRTCYSAIGPTGTHEGYTMRNF
jgi:hypothetical protein